MMMVVMAMITMTMMMIYMLNQISHLSGSLQNSVAASLYSDRSPVCASVIVFTAWFVYPIVLLTNAMRSYESYYVTLAAGLRGNTLFCRAVSNLSQRLLHKMANSSVFSIARIHACWTSKRIQGTQYVASKISDNFIKCICRNIKLCTRKMELATEVKFYLDFHHLWRRTPTNGSDVKHAFPRCLSAATSSGARDTRGAARAFSCRSLSWKRRCRRKCAQDVDQEMCTQSVSSSSGAPSLQEWPRSEYQQLMVTTGGVARRVL